MNYPRVNYEMTKADLDKILDACKPTPVIMIGGYAGSTPQENANRAWAELGARMGFDPFTVESIPGRGECFFSAVPTENDVQRKEREEREAKEKVAAEIKRLNDEILERQTRLAEITDFFNTKGEGKA